MPNELTEEWQQRGAEDGRQFAALTDTLHRGTFDVSVRDHQAIKHIGRAQNLRDSMTRVELALSTLGGGGGGGDGGGTAPDARQPRLRGTTGRRAGGGRGRWRGAAGHRGAHRPSCRQRRELQDAAPGPDASATTATATSQGR